jgi:hypothetical protein
MGLSAEADRQTAEVFIRRFFVLKEVMS